MTLEEAIETLRNTAWLGSNDNREKTERAVEMAITALQAQDGDTISRRDAIRIVDSIDTWKAGWRGDAIESLKALPSAQPEPSQVARDIATILENEKDMRVIARQDNSCDGCKYENADDGVLVPCGFCKRSHPDNYERRTDEQTISE